MIDAAAVIARLREVDARSGGCREAWTPHWAEERDKLDAQARDCGRTVAVQRDAFANTWYVLPGQSSETILVGSHSDSVPGGGWLDGMLGLQAGLGLLAAVAGGPAPARTLAVVDWADEEGTRFGRSLLGSSAATGALTSAELNGLAAADGTRAAEVAGEYGFDAAALGTPSFRLTEVVAALELHIEQGPRLQAAGRRVAAVSGCLGVRRRRLVISGTAGHAGGLPMADRRDPVRAAAALVVDLFAFAQASGGLATAGELSAVPSLITAVPAHVRLGLDLRHAELGPLNALEAHLAELAAASPCPVHTVPVYDQDPICFDPALVAAARQVTGGAPSIVSGPLHDSASLASAGVPAVMLFVPSTGGVSHVREEDTPEPDLTAGIQALHGLAAPLLAGKPLPTRCKPPR